MRRLGASGRLISAGRARPRRAWIGDHGALRRDRCRMQTAFAWELVLDQGAGRRSGAHFASPFNDRPYLLLH
jgi:hypothetical protein